METVTLFRQKELLFTDPKACIDFSEGLTEQNSILYEQIVMNHFMNGGHVYLLVQALMILTGVTRTNNYSATHN